MDTDKLLFEVTTKQGHKYKAYLNGKIEGFPEGSFLINHAFPLFSKLSATSNRPRVQTRGRTDNETKTNV